MTRLIARETWRLPTAIVPGTAVLATELGLVLAQDQMGVGNALIALRESGQEDVGHGPGGQEHRLERREAELIPTV